MDDWLKSGWYLLANRDFHIIAGHGKDDTDSTCFHTA